MRNEWLGAHMKYGEDSFDSISLRNIKLRLAHPEHLFDNFKKDWNYLSGIKYTLLIMYPALLVP